MINQHFVRIESTATTTTLSCCLLSLIPWHIQGMFYYLGCKANSFLRSTITSFALGSMFASNIGSFTSWSRSIPES